MAKLVNLAKVNTATTGTGTITLGTAVSGFLTFALAGVFDGDLVQYAIRDGANSEAGLGIYTAAGTTLTRGPITSTAAGNAAISLSGSAVVAVTAVSTNVFLSSGGAVPLAASMTQFGNTGTNSATLSDANNALKMVSIAKNNFNNGRIGVGRALASTTFDLITHCRWHFNQVAEFTSCGLVLYNSTTGAYSNMYTGTNHFISDVPPTRLYCRLVNGTHFESDTSGSDVETVIDTGQMLMSHPEFMRVTGDGTTITYYTSPDQGENWVARFSTTFAAAFAGGNPDRVGIVLWPFGAQQPNGQSHQITAFVKHWAQI